MLGSARALFCGLLVAATVSVGGAAADPWTSPDLSRRVFLIGHEVENFDLAITNLCFPYLIQNAEEATFHETTGIIPRTPAPPSMARGHAFWVGRYVTAAVSAERGARSCDIFSERGEPEALHAALMARLAQLPVALAAAGLPMRPTTYTQRELLCSPANGPQYFALIDTGPRTNGDRGPPIYVTLWRDGHRDARCDVAAQRPRPPNPSAEAAAFAAGLEGCRLLIGGGDAGPVFEAAGIHLTTPPARLGDTPLAQRRDNGIVDFFGLDARIHLALPTSDASPPILVITDEGQRKCEAAAASHLDLAATVLPALQAREADWARVDAETLRRPNGANARVLTSANPDGATFVRVFMSGGS